MALSLLALLQGCGAALVNATTPRTGVAEDLAIAYGSHPRQTFDLYEPRGLPPGPVIVFLHGGSWQTGSPRLYPFVGRSLAAAGITVAIPSYRLYPEVTFPAFVEDAAAALAAIRARLGSDRAYVLMGHSAGAHMGALVAFDPRYLAAHGLSPCEAVQAFVGISGPYDFLPMSAQLQRVFPEPVRAESQPIAFASGRHPPALLIHGAADRVVEAEDSRRLAEALSASGNRATLLLYPEAGHIDIIAAFAPLLRGSAPTLRDVVAFVRAEAKAGYPGCP